jgi:hypothetical protein
MANLTQIIENAFLTFVQVLLLHLPMGPHQSRGCTANRHLRLIKEPQQANTYEEHLFSDEAHILGVKNPSMSYQSFEVEIVFRMTLNPAILKAIR